MATIAVFVALGGTGYAAVHLPRNSVGSRELRRHAVTNAKIAPHAVSASRVKPNSLTGAQIDEVALAKVPSSGYADRAASAATAETATNASAVGGLTAAQLVLGCPAGTTPFAGACMETAARAATDWDSAARTCVHAGRTLPSAAQEEWYIDDNNLQTTEWTGDLATSDTALSTDGHGGFNEEMRTASNPYRCAVSPGN
jgi:hypothetical protein